MAVSPEVVKRKLIEKLEAVHVVSSARWALNNASQFGTPVPFLDGVAVLPTIVGLITPPGSD